MAEMNILGAFSGFFSQVVPILKIFLPILGLIIALIIALIWVRNRKLYRFPISIISERERGGTKERETRGAIIGRRGSSSYFVFKVGLFKRLILPKLPTLSGMTGYDRLFFFQRDPHTFIQLKRNISKEVMDFEPVESDVKYGALIEARKIEMLTQKESFLQKYGSHLLLLSGMIIIMVMFILMLEKFDPGLMVSIAEKMQATAEALARAK